MSFAADGNILNLNQFKLRLQQSGLDPLSRDEEKFVMDFLQGAWSTDEIMEEIRKRRDLEASPE
ncbi:hypothetical protein LG201_07230 [Methylobacillus gramineus]|uniref:hypothetical protein n=1 Tax=Methylobacillus gramineus TaxID=755169 RepID=UPI001CFF89A2|nr:hypothetical protein [Methylobacillus gramineus]MCB5184994.1 hypothetical protein [Methylobacillus gramineus]